jgi:5-methylcytosine-specific restriction enzyme A
LSRVIDSVNHRKDREIYLEEHPLCERCEKKGIIKPAFILHHKNWNQENRSRDNFEALCNDCHEIEHNRKSEGCDVNGIPLNKNHHWNRG